MYLTSLRVSDEQVHAKHTLLGSYRMLREHNHFGVFESIRFAIWLVYGNEEMPPGEFAAWANRQIEEHPLAVGIVLGVSGYSLIMWVIWMVVPHGYFGRW